jgi:hypothetical protein
MSFDFNSYEDINKIEIDNKGNKINISNSNILSQDESYLDIPAKSKKVASYSTVGSYPVSNPRSAFTIPKIEIQNNVLSDITKKIDIKKQKQIKKPLSLVSKKGSNISKEKVGYIPNSNTPVINSGQGVDFWSTIRLFFIRLFHIKK